MKAQYLLLCVGLSLSLASFSEPPHLIAQLHANTPLELSQILTRAERWSETHKGYVEQPIALVLHGSETNIFLKQNYQQYKTIVDQAAKLDAFNVIDIQVCETWMGGNEVSRNQLPPFIETVNNGPQRIDDLIQAGYQSF